MKSNISEVIDNNYCVGCGACSVVNNKLSMIFDNEGKYIPADINNLEGAELEKLDLVCPFSSKTKNETVLSEELFRNNKHFDSDLGHYEALFASSVNEKEYRIKGSSGGIGTWILAELKSKNLIDGVIHIKESNKENKLFEYGLSSSLDEISKGASSRYYPVEISDILNSIRDKQGTFVITAIPCVAKAIRNICRVDKELNDKIKYIVGIFCGHMKSTKYADLLALESGINPYNENGYNINFRVKKKGHNSDDYFTKIQQDSNIKITRNKDFISTNWGLGLMKLKACDYCDDVTAETADITIGDAWLRKYTSDYRGTNVLVVRNQELLQLLQNARNEGRIELEKLSRNDVYNSQAGGFRHKKEGLSYRLHLLETDKKWYPIKRVSPSNKISEKRKNVINLRMKLQEKSINQNLEGMSFDDFISEMSLLINEHKKLTKPSMIEQLKRVIKKVL
ncbi:Coenzyme F420 hydrogenase/dehydrogenase, beta subunit C-terminal domain [Flammeovirga pacifica]|uniref:4Fe-4S ferredoxin-type domain-containing protein n=1 Tax=Flammeovirga pacifica TaxID=915059 RepID=A0A1S1Z171_FLAPC|nr:Coenzyme F420 hydrogenase/dehydrogenase, beta subunit C-terminal domain [Flammeovirga pacifica]OHX67018.1 hypothetical protein NH26_12020 [Flammeovirga pacifica]